MADSIADRVTTIIAEHLAVEPSKVTPEASIVDDLGADSLDVAEVWMAIEQEFGIDVPDDAVDRVETVRDTVQLIERLIAAGGQHETPEAWEPDAGEDRDAATRRLCRNIGAAILSGMASTDTSLEAIDVALDEARGWAKEQLLQLVAGEPISMRDVALIAHACSCTAHFELAERAGL